MSSPTSPPIAPARPAPFDGRLAAGLSGVLIAALTSGINEPEKGVLADRPGGAHRRGIERVVIGAWPEIDNARTDYSAH